MTPNPLKRLHALGQSVWLDYIHRDLFTSGRLHALIEEDALSGMTSNPAIFHKAITSGSHYDEEIFSLASEGEGPNEIYESLSQHDVQCAADEFRAVYEASEGMDGYVSLEVNPHLARDTQGTIAEARRLWTALARPNVMIKIPGTREGLGAIRQAISEGININVTLLFSVARYREVLEAYLSGLEQRVAQGKPIRSIVSVASFFISRIDALVDPMIEKGRAAGADASAATAAHGQVAIANAKLAYQVYLEASATPRFQALRAQGAQAQRLLWASTSTKNPLYSDVKYAEALIGPETVDTMPMETVDAYRDHGEPQRRLTQDLDEARAVIASLPGLGIDLDAVTQRLENEGVDKFIEPFDQLLQAVQSKHAAARPNAPAPTLRA